MAVIWVGSLLCMAWAGLESALLHLKHNPLQPYPSKSFPRLLVIWCVDRVVQHKMPQHDACVSCVAHGHHMWHVLGMVTGPSGHWGGGGGLLQVDTFTAERYSPICVSHAMGMVWALHLRLSLPPPLLLTPGWDVDGGCMKSGHDFQIRLSLTCFIHSMVLCIVPFRA